MKRSTPRRKYVKVKWQKRDKNSKDGINLSGKSFWALSLHHFTPIRSHKIPLLAGVVYTLSALGTVSFIISREHLQNRRHDKLSIAWYCMVHLLPSAILPHAEQMKHRPCLWPRLLRVFWVLRCQLLVGGLDGFCLEQSCESQNASGHVRHYVKQWEPCIAVLRSSSFSSSTSWILVLASLHETSPMPWWPRLFACRNRDNFTW